MRTRARGAVLLVVLILLMSGCRGGDPAPPAAAATASPTPPTYAAGLEPAAAVLALVPEAAVTLTVTDFDQVRLDLAVEGLTTASPLAEQDGFWTRAPTTSPLLTTGLLRPVEARLRSGYGLSRTDVSWEAHFSAADGTELGWVLALRADVDQASVQRAVGDGVGPLAGSTWRPADLLVTSGVSDDGAASWAADPATVDLVGLPATSTYVERACVSRPDVPPGLAELSRYSVQFESTLVTARLGADRLDLFDRLRSSTASASFLEAYEGGVADPLTGRIGFRMVDAPLAAEQARRRQLPFAVCAGPS